MPSEDDLIEKVCRKCPDHAVHGRVGGYVYLAHERLRGRRREVDHYMITPDTVSHTNLHSIWVVTSTEDSNFNERVLTYAEFAAYATIGPVYARDTVRRTGGLIPAESLRWVAEIAEEHGVALHPDNREQLLVVLRLVGDHRAS